MRVPSYTTLLLQAVLVTSSAGACATHPPDSVSVDSMNRTINALRALNGAQDRQIEELQNRIFILQDRLDAQKVVAERAASPHLPVVALHQAEESDGSYRGSDTRAQYPGNTDVEYAGDAAVSSNERPVLRLVGSGPPTRENPVATPKRVEVVGERAASGDRPAPIESPPRRAGQDADGAAEEIAVLSTRSLPPAARAAASPQAPPSPQAAPAPQAAAVDPMRLYRQSLDLLKSGQHVEAVAGFRRFIAANPEHDYADNAQYWLGECFYDIKDLRSAVREFRRVAERYPQGNKVPDALLKAGYSYVALGDKDTARQVLQELVRSYPRHDASRLAAERLRELDGGAATIDSASASTTTEVR